MTPRPNDEAQLDLLDREFSLIHELLGLFADYCFPRTRDERTRSRSRVKAIEAELETVTEWPPLAEVFGPSHLGRLALGRMRFVNAYTVEQVVTWSPGMLSDVSQLGPAIREHIEDALAGYGLSLLADG